MQKTSKFVDFSELSGNAQRAFCIIEKCVLSELQEEIYITKEILAWDLQLSIPSVKLALRELKEAGYIIPRNENSSWVRIGEDYGIRREGRTVYNI